MDLAAEKSFRGTVIRDIVPAMFLAPPGSPPMPVTGPLVGMEEKMVPLVAGWGRLVQENGVPAINFADHPDLNAFDCPEWSHLSAADFVEFSKRLVPHLVKALNQSPAGAPESKSASR